MSSPEAKKGAAVLVIDDNQRDVSLEMSRESFKSAFYLLSGKPDSMCKVFNEPIIVDKSDIIELNRLVTRKLANHECDAQVVNTNVSFKKNITKEFGVWKEFEEHDFAVSDVTESVTMQWDFLIKLPAYQAPQRHILTVRIATELNPFHILQTIFADAQNEVDLAAIEGAPVFCRVNFINALLSDELINVVDKWYRARKRPAAYSHLIARLKRQRKSVARFIHYSLPVLVVGLAFASFIFLSKNWVDESITATHLRISSLWIFGAFLSFSLSNKIGGLIARRAFHALSEYGKSHVFRLTNGDLNFSEKVAGANKKLIKGFVFNMIISLLVDLSVAIVAGWLITLL